MHSSRGLPGTGCRPCRTARVPRHARHLRGAPARAPRRRRRLGLEHLRLAGGHRLVPGPPRSLRPARREPRSRATRGLAAHRQDGRRAPPRRVAPRACSTVGALRARLDARPWRAARPDRVVREHHRRRRFRRARRTDSPAARRAPGRIRARARTTWPSSASPASSPEKGLDTLIRAAAAAGRR